MADLSQIELDGTTYNLKDVKARYFLPYGVCDTAADTAAKTVAIDGFGGYVAGMTIAVKFTNANSAASPTLKINSLEAKSIYQYGTTAAAGTAATTGWQAGAVVILVYDGTGWQFNKGYNTNNTYTVTSVWCNTSASTAAKASSNGSYYALRTGNIFEVTMRYSNSAKSALTFNVNSTGAKPIYIDGTASSATNYTLPAGKYLVYYDGTNYYFRTDGKAPISISGDSATVNGYTVESNVPGNAFFTDTHRPVKMNGTQILSNSQVSVIPLDLVAGHNVALSNNSGEVTFNSYNQIIIVDVASFSTLPQTISDSRVTADYIVVSSILSDPSAQRGSWTVSTSSGSLTIDVTMSGTTPLGSITGATTMRLILAIPDSTTDPSA